MSCHKNKTNKTFGHLQIATPFKDTAVSVVVGSKIVESSGCTRGSVERCTAITTRHVFSTQSGSLSSPYWWTLPCLWLDFVSVD